MSHNSQRAVQNYFPLTQRPQRNPKGLSTLETSLQAIKEKKALEGWQPYIKLCALRVRGNSYFLLISDVSG